MRTCAYIVASAIALLVSCEAPTLPASGGNPLSLDHLDQARWFSERGRLDSALSALESSFQYGNASPMSTVCDTSLAQLINDPETRPGLRDMLKKYAIESKAAMVRVNEPGKPIIIAGCIVDEATKEPLEGVKVELVQADDSGFYFHEQSSWTPRLFAYLVTDELGCFEVSTIYPGRYSDDENNWVPSHIHFTLEHEGYRSYGSEFTFDDDPVFIANGNTEDVPVAERKTATEPAEPTTYGVIIGMQRE